MSNIIKLFNLKNNYSMKELSDAYKRKILEIENNNSLADIDQYLLKTTYKKYYNRARYDDFFNFNLFDHQRLLDHIGSNTTYHSRSYKSITNKNGLETVYETKEEIKDGKKNKTAKAFKRYPDGKVIPIDVKEDSKYKSLK